MTYSIWLVPNRKNSIYLNKIVKNLAKSYGAPGFVAHITVYSGVSNLQKAKSVVNLIKSRPITTTKTGVGQSDYLWKTLYIKIRKTEQLRHIHKSLANNLDEKYRFEPHISLIYKNMDQKTKRKIKTNLKIKNSFVFDRLVIIRSSKNVYKWKKLYSASLRATRRA